MKLKTVEEYLQIYDKPMGGIGEVINTIISDAQAEIDEKDKRIDELEKQIEANLNILNKEVGILLAAKQRIAELEATQLQPLPDEMPEEFPVLVGGMSYGQSIGYAQSIWNNIRQRYGTPAVPWWATLKEGDKYISGINGVKKLGRIELLSEDRVAMRPENCRPYIGPTAAEARAKLSDEEYEVLKKHIKEEMK